MLRVDTELKGGLFSKKNHSRIPSFPNGLASYAQETLILILVQAKRALSQLGEGMEVKQLPDTKEQ